MRMTVVAVCIGILALPAAAEPPSGKPATLAGSGRFVFGQISDYRRDQYMLDTQTGRLWKIVQHKPARVEGANPQIAIEGFDVLQSVPYVDDTHGGFVVTPR